MVTDIADCLFCSFTMFTSEYDVLKAIWLCCAIVLDELEDHMNADTDPTVVLDAVEEYRKSREKVRSYASREGRADMYTDFDDTDFQHTDMVYKTYKSYMINGPADPAAFKNIEEYYNTVNRIIAECISRIDDRIEDIAVGLVHSGAIDRIDHGTRVLVMTIYQEVEEAVRAALGGEDSL